MSAPTRPRCYVASPLGFTAAGRDWNARVLLPTLATVVDPVDPWSLTGEDEIVAARRVGDEALARLYAEIAARNTAALRSCALLVALLDGQELDAGTAAELGYATAHGLRCYGLRTDLRQTGETGARCNLQVQAFVHDSGGEIVGSLPHLVRALQSIA